MMIELFNQVQFFDFDIILTVQRGGLVPAVCFSHMSGVRRLYIIYVKHSENDSIWPVWKKKLDFDACNFIPQGKKILFIDDIIGTGKTMKLVFDYCKKRGVDEFKTACLFLDIINYKEPISIDFIGEKTKDWIVFPWENQANSTLK